MYYQRILIYLKCAYQYIFTMSVYYILPAYWMQAQVHYSCSCMCVYSSMATFTCHTNSLATIGGGRQSNQVGLIDRQENISMVKIKCYGALSKSGGAAASQPHPSTTYASYCTHIVRAIRVGPVIVGPSLVPRPLFSVFICGGGNKFCHHK